MKTSRVAVLLALPVFVLASLFIGAGFRGSAPEEAEMEQPVSALSEQMSDGFIEAQVRTFDTLTYQIDVQFTPVPDSTITAGMPPELNLSMERMHMDGFEPPLEEIGTGAWRARGKLPMAGRWILSVGFGEEFAELIFVVE